jgi:hypothetical protein
MRITLSCCLPGPTVIIGCTLDSEGRFYWLQRKPFPSALLELLISALALSEGCARGPVSPVRLWCQSLEGRGSCCQTQHRPATVSFLFGPAVASAQQNSDRFRANSRTDDF